MGKNYSDIFKNAMVEKLSRPGSKSATALAEEIGVSQSTLSRWLREYGRFGTTGEGMRNKKRPQNWTAKEKMEAVIAYDRMGESERGQYLRGHGLYSVDIERWREEMLEALSKKPKKGDPKDKRIRDLESELRRKEKALAEAAALLVLKKKSPGDLGGRRGRKVSLADRHTAVEMIAEAVTNGARRSRACQVLDISLRTLQRWENDAQGDRRRGPRTVPKNALGEAERALIVPILADAGIYLASESSMHRVLREEKLLDHRQRSSAFRHHRPEEHVATGANQVWSWDIT